MHAVPSPTASPREARSTGTEAILRKSPFNREAILAETGIQITLTPQNKDKVGMLVIDQHLNILELKIDRFIKVRSSSA